MDEGDPYFVPEDWNKVRIVAKGPRIQTWVNGHAIEDLTNEQVYKTIPTALSASNFTLSATTKSSSPRMRR